MIKKLKVNKIMEVPITIWVFVYITSNLTFHLKIKTFFSSFLPDTTT